MVRKEGGSLIVKVCGEDSPLPISHQESTLNFMEYCLLVFFLSL